MVSLTWAVKPGAGDDDRLATIARELGDAVRQQDTGDIRQLLREAQQVAAELFLDPDVPAMLPSPSDLGTADALVSAADRLTTVIRQLQQQAKGGEGPVVTAWPATIRGGERLLHYRLVRALGGGGMGDVSLAWDERLDRYVALKRLRDDQDVSRGYRRLEREARTGARLRHEHVVMIHSLEYVGEEPVLVQEYIAGTDLSAHLRTLEMAEVIRIAAEVAAGLAAAHDAGILHRDLKPGNVRLRPDGTALILDFGLGKAFLASPEDQTQVVLTEEGTVMGTPAYMSPEQIRAESLTTATDVFSFGVLLYELLAGRLPFMGKTRAELSAAILYEEPAPMDHSAVPSHIVELVFACLAKDPEARPAITAVLHDLRGAPLPSPVPPRHVRFLDRIERAQARIVAGPERDHPWLAAQRKRAQAGVDTHAVTFEFDLSFEENVPNTPIGQMKPLLRSVQVPDPDVYIGQVSEDERYKLQRGEDGVYARFAMSRQHAYWAAAQDGSFCYVTTVPLLDRINIPIEFLLGQTITCLQYAARYATLFNAEGRDAKLLLHTRLENTATRKLAAADWSHRFGASLDALNKRADSMVHSRLLVSLRFLRDELPSCVKLLFDDMMVYFDFLTIPPDYYRQALNRTETA
jgi:serine/threonine protein kinase